MRAVCTTEFTLRTQAYPRPPSVPTGSYPTATGMARMWGAPDYPTIYTEHPIENLSREALRARAEQLAPLVVQVLTGEG